MVCSGKKFVDAIGKMPKLQLREGSKYLLRNGVVVGPLRRSTVSALLGVWSEAAESWAGQWLADGGEWYAKTGGENPNDIVAEYAEPPAESTLTETFAPLEQIGATLEAFDKQIQTITQRRGDVYGHPADDFATAARLMAEFDHIEPPQLRHALRMICVKLARIKNTPTHLDSYVDIVGYARTAVMVMDKLGLEGK